jgi:hypothetical protein
MKKLASLVISGLLLFGSVACNNTAKTSGSAPDNASTNPQTPSQSTVKSDLNDAQSGTRRNQLNSDIRANEQRNDTTGGDKDRASGDLATEVRSKLEANIPNGQLTVQANDQGAVTVAGTVPHSDQISKIDKLAREIKGVKSVNVKAVVAPPKGK